MLADVADREEDIEQAREMLRKEPPRQPAELTRFMTKLLDDMAGVPGTNIRFGLDPILSIIPGVGSTAGTMLSVVMMVDAIRLRMPVPVLARMGLNALIDWLIGLVPAIGFLGDIAWRANRRNLRLLNRTIADRDEVRSASMRYWIAAGAILAGIVVLVLVATVWLVVWILSMLT